MKTLTHTPSRLVFEHRSWGLGVMMALLVLAAVGAAAISFSLHETWTFGDDFVRVGLGFSGAALLLAAVAVRAVRRRRLVLDADAGTVRLQGLGMGKPRTTEWTVKSLEEAYVSEGYLGEARYIHATTLRWADGTTTSLGAMDLPSRDGIERIVQTINAWLAAHRAA